VRRPLRLAAALVLAVLVAAPAAQADRTYVTRDMHGDRYCEYLAVRGTPPDLLADVWNTYTFNDCPEARWRALDAAAVARELGALAVLLNGPRFWLVDRARITIPSGEGQVRTFPNGLRMRLLTTVEVPADRAPYRETVVRRANEFRWSRRHRVHELVAPGGKVYVMQAYSQIVDRRLTLRRLPRLGARLALPAGWHFRTRRLRRDLTIRTTGRAVVLQDELQNTYQLRR
jgi:hypothetical protein